MLALLALAAGVGAFVYVYSRLRQIRLATLEHAEGLARGASRATQTLSRLIGLSADILQLLISPRDTSVVVDAAAVARRPNGGRRDRRALVTASAIARDSVSTRWRRRQPELL